MVTSHENENMGCQHHHLGECLCRDRLIATLGGSARTLGSNRNEIVTARKREVLRYEASRPLKGFQPFEQLAVGNLTRIFSPWPILLFEPC
jgi:hypothetical protein